MRVSYRWLKKIAQTDLDPEALGERLTMGGLELEEIIDFGFLGGRLVAGRVLSVDEHPDADNLSVCQVDAGAHGDLPIVCGAPNVRLGMVSVVALEGARLPDGRLVERADIRGVESRGMLCSGAEIGWNSDADGIIELPDDTPIGEPFDCLLDIKPTPNRPDALSVFGMARDLAGLEGRELYAAPPRLRETMDPIGSMVQVTVRDKKACPRYTCRMVRNVHIKPSPVWLQRAIESAGLRPVNNVVDITNYLLVEYGQPMHAFDLDKLVNKTLEIRRAEAGEKIDVIDGRTIELDEEDLVIADAERPVALAGVMGGVNTEIGEATTNVLLESAFFDPLTVRRTASRHDIGTDSSFRFERGADIGQTLHCLNRAAQMVRELCGGEILRGAIDTNSSPTPAEPITLNIPRLLSTLGVRLAPRAIADQLVHLGFEIIRSDRDQMVVRPPTYRVDCSRDVDLVEEIARVYGYDKIPETTPYIRARRLEGDRRRRPVRVARQALRAAGFREIVSYAFTSREAVARCAIETDGLVEILNPLSQDQAVMRPSLAPSLLEAVGANQRRGNEGLRLFEMGKEYHARPGDTEHPYCETQVACLVLTEDATPRVWRQGETKADFFTVKGAVESVLDTLGVEQRACEAARAPWLHPGRSAAFRDGDDVLALFGEVHPDVARAFDLRGRVLMGEVRMDALTPRLRFERSFRPFGRFPRVDRDIALKVDRDKPVGDLEAVIREAGGEWLESIRLFDLYEGDRIEEGKKSVAFALSFRHPDRTLRDEEIEAAVKNITDRLATEHAAALRAG